MQVSILWVPNCWDSGSIKNAECTLKVFNAFVYALTCKKLILITSNFNDFPSVTQRIALKGLCKEWKSFHKSV